jgi:hypothetical protein
VTWTISAALMVGGDVQLLLVEAPNEKLYKFSGQLRLPQSAATSRITHPSDTDAVHPINVENVCLRGARYPPRAGALSLSRSEARGRTARRNRRISPSLTHSLTSRPRGSG